MANKLGEGYYEAGERLKAGDLVMEGKDGKYYKVKTKQEEIREGAIGVLRDARLGDCDCDECSGLLVDAVFSYLKSVGMVRKVEREFPHPWRDDCMSAHSETCKTCDNCEILEWAWFDLIEAGFEAVEELT